MSDDNKLPDSLANALGEIVSAQGPLMLTTEKGKPGDKLAVSNEWREEVDTLRHNVLNAEMQALCSIGFGQNPFKVEYGAVDPKRVVALLGKIQDLFNDEKVPINLRWVTLGAALASQQQWLTAQEGVRRMEPMIAAHKSAVQIREMREMLGDKLDEAMGELPGGQRASLKEFLDAAESGNIEGFLKEHGVDIEQMKRKHENGECDCDEEDEAHG